MKELIFYVRDYLYPPSIYYLFSSYFDWKRSIYTDGIFLLYDLLQLSSGLLSAVFTIGLLPFFEAGFGHIIDDEIN